MTAGGGAAQTSAAVAAIKGLCPRCGAGAVFAGTVRFADRCSACGLDYAGFNVGDGPAALLTMVIGAIVMTGVATVQLKLDPPPLVQFAIWIPVTALLVVVALRVAKAALLTLEYRNAAREGRLEDR